MVSSSPSSDPPPTSRAAPGAQVTPTLAPATTILPLNGPSQSPFADPKESSTASAVKQDPQPGDPGRSMDPPGPPTKTRDPPGTVKPPLSSPRAEATSAPAPAAGAVAPQPSNNKSGQSSDPPSDSPATKIVASQPSNGKPWQSSDPPQNPPAAAAETSGPAVLVAPPEAGHPSDPKLEGAPHGETISTTYASPPGREPGLPAAVGYSPVSISGHPIAPGPNGGIIVASSTIAAGEQAIIYGHVLSAGSSSVIIDSDIYALPTSVAPLQSLILDPNVQGSNSGAVFASTTILPFSRASNGDVIIASSTIAVGNQAAIDGHAFSVGISSVAVDGIPYSPPSQTAQIGSLVPTPVLLSGNPIATGPNDDIVIASSTIAVGDQATLYGHVVSAGSSNIVVDGSTYARSFSAGAVSQQTGSSGSDLLSRMARVMSSASVGMGGLIMSGFGDGPSQTSAGGVVSGSNIPTSAGSVAIGSSTPTATVNVASGSNVPIFTGGSVKSRIDVRLLSLTIMFNAIGWALAFC